MRELGFDYAVRFAGYQQVFQELLDPASLFACNREGINVVLVRFEDWSAAEENARRLAEAMQTATNPLILVTCPATAGHEQEASVAEKILFEGVAPIAFVHTISAAEVAGMYPVDEIHDPHADELGHVPYTPRFFVALATAIARKIHALVIKPYKVAAVDCDDTLWAGICGEDGPANVVIDPMRRALQEFLAERRRSGLLLALCSKNNEEDVVETFRAHPDMPLRFDDFAARRINWESKSANLAALAEDLDLALDSFILVDDSEKECMEAQAGAPEVVALALPRRSEDIPAFLRHVWAFDRARVTAEDRRRPEMYAQREERNRAQRAAANLEEFLAGLKLEVKIAPMRPDQVARVAQLTQRTNQMNATLRRRTEAELAAFDDGECLAVEVSDRFGSYGLAGAMIFRPEGDALVVDTFLLSCRALGRRVEHRMYARLEEIARERGLARVEIPLVIGPRNRPAQLFLETVGQTAVESSPALAAPQAAASRKRIDYGRIAGELRDPAAIEERIRAAGQRIARPRSVADPPRNPLEHDLADLFAELLNIPAVGIHDNFFELGGHSLLAVQLLSRVRQNYGVDLSLEVVYSGEFTVAELAKAVELKEIELSGANYDDLLRELEGLSDEDARALLAEEQDAV